MNEAAERLRSWAAGDDDADVFCATLDEALPAELRETVEWIKHEVLFQRTRLGTPPEKIRVTDLLAILDAEAER